MQVKTYISLCGSEHRWQVRVTPEGRHRDPCLILVGWESTREAAQAAKTRAKAKVPRLLAIINEE